MTWVSDEAVAHLRDVADWPDLTGKKYEIVAPLARGGMGTVYRAADRELGREVALKVLSAPAAGAEAAARMLREARIIARLEHPGIVPVHDVGTLPDGRIYYAMKLVRGRRLDEEARAGRPLAELLRIFERICEAVAFAHAHGVIHRDLKPQNVMVGPFGEVLVMDWGVAKLLSDASQDPVLPAVPGPGSAGASAPTATADGTILGTPGYMAPEQARGDVDLIDPRSDVYALGAVLCFLLTGAAPGRSEGADTAATTRTWGGHAEPGGGRFARLRGRRPDVPRALEAICLKALSSESVARYPGAGELGAEVSRFLAGAAVEAYREGPLERARRFGRKYRAPILLVLAYLVMRTLLLIFTRT